MRCGWDCQVSGYDDESQPLPPFRAQWQEFTAAIKDGRTPEYHGKRKKVIIKGMTGLEPACTSEKPVRARYEGTFQASVEALRMDLAWRESEIAD